jgi:hypothetical protein
MKIPVAALALFAIADLAASAHECLPQSVTFKGEAKFRATMAKARAGNWHSLPMDDRIMRFAQELRGTPYVGYTLEIDDHVESASVNFTGLDCWTFFETSLGLARTIEGGRYDATKSDLLRQIEFTRYRGGVCGGNYLDRIHYLAEWFFENDARGVARDITRQLGGAEKVTNRTCSEMTTLWKSYRYLKNNPELRPAMAASEAKVSRLPVYFIPKSKVAGIEGKLRNGDIIGIVTKYQGGFCSHVGLAYKDSTGKTRFMHASTTYKKVVVDSTLAEYLNSFSKHAGIMVARPLEASETVRDTAVYKKNLARLTR